MLKTFFKKPGILLASFKNYLLYTLRSIDLLITAKAHNPHKDAYNGSN